VDFRQPGVGEGRQCAVVATRGGKIQRRRPAVSVKIVVVSEDPDERIREKI